MILRMIYFLCIQLVLWTPTWAKADLKQVLEKMDAYIPLALDAWGAPGCAVVIVKDDEVVYIKAFGEKHQGKGDAVDIHTAFPLASVTKNMTAFILAQLIEEGKLSWDDPLKKHLPELELSDPEFTAKITIQDAASQRVGLPSFTGDTLGYLEWTGVEILHGIKEVPFEAPPGREYAYQNIFYGFLGLIIERVTGKTLQEVYQERIFGPLGFEDTTIGEVRDHLSIWERIQSWFSKKPAVRVVKNLSGLHDHIYPRAHAREIAYNKFLYALPSTSGINSSVSDLGKWLRFWLRGAKINGKAMLSEASIAHLHKAHINIPTKESGGFQFPGNRVKHNSYGVGFFNHDYLGHPVWTQMGGMNGMRTLLSILPEEKIGIITISNLGGMRIAYLPESIRHKFFDLLFEAPDEIDWAAQDVADMQRKQKKFYDMRAEYRLRSPQPASELSAYEGTYEHPLYGQVVVMVKGGKLFWQYRNRSPIEMTHFNGDLFVFKSQDLTNSFPAVDGGEMMFGVQGNKANALTINLLFEGRDHLFKRVK